MNRARMFCIVAGAAMAFALSGCSELSNREDFAAQWKDKTEEQVLKYAGKPAAVDSTNPSRVIWIYKSRTYDVPTRRTDSETDVIFVTATDGKLHVAEVVFK